MVEDVTTENPTLFLGQQVSTSENALHEDHVEHRGRRVALGSVEAHQLKRRVG
jgi:hypothetical protein